jgi:hypothetical protein
MLKIIFIFSLLFSFSFSDNLKMNDVVLDAIKDAECYKENGKYETQFIRINEENDVQKALSEGFDVKGHILKCYEPDMCVIRAQQLILLGIYNLDMGAYQINYKYNPLTNFFDYFEESKEREHVNRILMSLVSKFGYSWETLGRYHHYDANDKSRNIEYYNKLRKYITRNGN